MSADEMVPTHWMPVIMGDLIDGEKLLVQNGFPHGGHNQTGQGVIHLRPFNVSEDGSLDLTQVKYVPAPPPDSAYWVELGDIIFNNTNSEELVGKTAYCDGQGAFVLSNHMTIVRVLDANTINGEWLARKLQLLWQRGEFRRLCRRHVNQASVGVERFRSLEFSLPPLSEQKAIAQVLNAVQEAKRARQHELALERERKAALTEYLLTHGTRGADSVSTEVGQLSANWKIVGLGEIVSISYGIQAAVAHLTDPKGGIPILTNVNIKNDGRLDFSTLRYFPLPYRLRERGLLRKGDVLFNWRSGSQEHVGKTALFNEDGEFTCSSFILRLRPSDRVRNSYLSHYLHAIKARGYFAQKRQQSSVNSVFNASVAATIPIGLPTLEEQDEIAAVLNSCDRKIATLEKEQQLTEELFRVLLEELMTGRLPAVPLIEEGQRQ